MALSPILILDREGISERLFCRFERNAVFFEMLCGVPVIPLEFIVFHKIRISRSLVKSAAEVFP